jgi:CRP-like cAMP-binding protein
VGVHALTKTSSRKGEDMSLAQTDLFRGVEAADLAPVQALAVHRDLLPGEPLYGPGKVADAIVFVEMGSIDIMSAGSDTPIVSLGSGQLVGQVAYFDRTTAGFAAVAREQTRLLSIGFDAFEKLLNERPHLAALVYRNAARSFAHVLREMAMELRRPYF